MEPVKSFPVELPVAPKTHVPVTFRALRHPNYRLWFFGQGISLIGTWMQTMAQQILIYRLTGSAVALGIVNFVAVIPLLPLTLWGGSISDRFPKQKIILCTQVAMLLQALGLAALVWTGTVEVWHVYLMSFLLGAAKAVDMPARHSFVVEMIEGKQDLTNAIGLNSAIFNGGRTLGPALAGIVIAATGEGNAFFLNALSFVAVIGSLLTMKNLPPAPPPPRSNILDHTSQGVRFVLHHQVLYLLLSIVAVNAFLSMPYSTLMPAFVDQNLSASAQPLVNFICGDGQRGLIECQAPEALPLGLLLSAVGVGAVLGALTTASLPERVRRGRMLTLGNLCFPLLLIVYALSRSMVLSLGVMILIGISFVLQNSMANSLLQVTAPDELRGRVMSLWSLMNQGMTQLGGLQAGFMADWLGTSLSVILGAVIALIYCSWVALRYPNVRNLA